MLVTFKRKTTMKKFYLLSLCIIITIIGNAQISRITESKIETEISMVFDSTNNMIIPRKLNEYDPSIQAYVGQKVFLKPYKKGRQNWGYSAIVTMDYNPNQPPYNYHLNDDEYERLSEKTYEVIKIDTFLNRYGGYIFTLKKIEDENASFKYIYNYHGNSYSDAYKFYPFVTMSHYNYLCSRLKGIKYIISNFAFTEKTWEEQNKETPIIPWTVKDISLDDEGVLFVIVNNGTEEAKIKIDDFLTYSVMGKFSRTIFSELEWNALVKKYGINMMKAVLAQKIKIGMAEELVKYSWGEPERINYSSYGSDQWCYDGQYVYMKNHKVTAWN